MTYYAPLSINTNASTISIKSWLDLFISDAMQLRQRTGYEVL